MCGVPVPTCFYVQCPSLFWLVFLWEESGIETENFKIDGWWLRLGGLIRIHDGAKCGKNNLGLELCLSGVARSLSLLVVYGKSKGNVFELKMNLKWTIHVPWMYYRWSLNELYVYSRSRWVYVYIKLLSIQQQQMNNMLWFAIISLNLNLLFGWAGWVVWWMWKGRWRNFISGHYQLQLELKPLLNLATMLRHCAEGQSIE